MTRKFLPLLLALVLVFSCVGFSAGAEDADVKTYTLMASVNASSGNWDDLWFFQYIEEELGIRFEIEQVSEASFEEKKNLALATNMYPDLFIGGITSAEIATYGEMGVFLPLEDYINWENTPAIMAWSEMYPDYLNSLKYPDGHIYDIHGMQLSSRELTDCRYWINHEWANEILGHLPTTLDEYYAYLKGVKEGDMNGNGDATDEIPMGGRFRGVMGSSENYHDCTIPILAAFGYTERGLEFMDGMAQFNPIQDNYKEYLKFMNKLFTEELIDPEYFTQAQDQFTAKLASGVTGAFVDFAHWLNISDENIWRQYGSNAPLTSQYNDQQIWPGHEFSVQGQQWIITDKCDDPQDLMRLLDYLFTLNPDEYEIVNAETSEHETFFGEYAQYVLRDDSGDFSQRFGAQLGTWEEHPEWGWEMTEYETNGETRQLVSIVYPTEEYTNRNDFVKKVMTPWAFPYMSANQAIVSVNAFDTGNAEGELTANVFEYLVPYYHEGNPGNFKFTAAESDELSLLESDLASYVDQMVSKFIIGDVSIDNEWDNFVKGCESRGIARYVEIYQTAYDRSYGAAE